MSTNPRFIKHWQRKAKENNSAPTKPVPGGFSPFFDNSNTGQSPIRGVTIPPCTSHVVLSEGGKEPKEAIDKYDVPYDEDFNAWFTKWEAQEAQRVIDGALTKYNEHGQEIDKDLEAYLSRVQEEIFRGLGENNSEGVLILTDREEIELVERKPGCFPPPLLMPDLTDEAPEDIKYTVQAEQQRFGASMQGIVITAAVYQDLYSKIEKEKIGIEVKKATTEVVSGKDTSPRAPRTGDNNTAAKAPSDIASTFSTNQCASKPPGWHELIPPLPTSRTQNCGQSRQSDKSLIANTNGEESNALSESETPRAIGYCRGIEAYIQTDTPYNRGPVTNSRSPPNTISPKRKRAFGNNPTKNFQGNRRRGISRDSYVQTESDNHQGNGGHAGHRERKKGRKHRGRGH
ncbi:hypothetical protein C7212DRAFT_347917 [Tuber magnatum]|uniref:Uncharacterized protein n=1 Tax=Tuber magnatum TaxID=42249 RepID=A0A317SFJ6_9PEZI|nr:hypothetical protein C7212DRAFT_347917 [Tuber magnatum]